MYQPQSPYTRIAFETIRHYLDSGELLQPADLDIPPEILSMQRACFVSLHLEKDELRGCIGTLEPHEKNLAEEIRRNAISAAFHDRRFHPLTKDEFPRIKLSVDVLTEPERIFSVDDLDPAIYGLIITDGRLRRGVLLPAIPGVESVERQIGVVKRKAGLEGVSDNDLAFYRFSSTRYH